MVCWVGMPEAWIRLCSLRWAAWVACLEEGDLLAAKDMRGGPRGLGGQVELGLNRAGTPGGGIMRGTVWFAGVWVSESLAGVIDQENGLFGWPRGEYVPPGVVTLESKKEDGWVCW